MLTKKRVVEKLRKSLRWTIKEYLEEIWRKKCGQQVLGTFGGRWISSTSRDRDR